MDSSRAPTATARAGRSPIDMDGIYRDIARQKQVMERMRQSGTSAQQPQSQPQTAHPQTLGPGLAPASSQNMFPSSSSTLQAGLPGAGLPGAFAAQTRPAGFPSSYSTAAPSSSSTTTSAHRPLGMPGATGASVNGHTFHAPGTQARGGAGVGMGVGVGGLGYALPQDPLARDLYTRLEKAVARLQAAEDQLRASQEREHALVEESARMEHDVRTLRTALERRDLQLAEMGSIEDFLVASQDRVRTLEDYIRGAPTHEELQEVQGSLAQQTALRETLEERCRDTEAHLGRLERELKEKIASGESLQRKLTAMEQHSTQTATSNESTISGLQRQLTAAMDECNAKQATIAKLTQELNEATARVHELQLRVGGLEMECGTHESRHVDRDTAYVDLQSQAAAHMRNIKALQAQLAEAEEARIAGQHKQQAQSTTIRDLRAAIAGLTEQNQTLLAQNQRLLPSVASGPRRAAGSAPAPAPTAVAPAAPEPARAGEDLDRLQDALQECFDVLQSVVTLAATRARGDDPALNQLLGLNGPVDAPIFARTNDPREQAHTVREMKKELEVIRNRITQQYAQDVGKDACGVQ
eukprot:m.45587 g.45587  ORF g.45587 m.45587 type:complete len:583 (-) comp11028_c0_seq2:45-1793(-)